MILYVIRRLISIALTFFVVSIIIFLMMHAVPGGPFDGNDMPLSRGGARQADGAARARSAALGPVRQLHEGRAASSISACPYQAPGETVLSLLADAWPPSLILGGLGVLIGAPLGILLGMAAALRRNTLDRLPRLGRRDARPDHPDLRHLDAADPRLRRVAPLAAGERLGQARALDPSDHRLRGDPDRDLCALHPLGDARHAQPAVRHRAPRQGAERAAHHLPARAAQLGDPDGHACSCRCSSASPPARSSSRRCSASRASAPTSSRASRTATIRSRWRWC